MVESEAESGLIFRARMRMRVIFPLLSLVHLAVYSRTGIFDFFLCELRKSVDILADFVSEFQNAALQRCPSSRSKSFNCFFDSL